MNTNPVRPIDRNAQKLVQCVNRELAVELKRLDAQRPRAKTMDAWIAGLTEDAKRFRAEFENADVPEYFNRRQVPGVGIRSYDDVRQFILDKLSYAFDLRLPSPQHFGTADRMKLEDILERDEAHIRRHAAEMIARAERGW